MRPPLAPLLDRLPDGVVHVPLPTGFPVGDVNCWVLPERPVTVVDPGVARQDSMRALDEGLRAAGIRAADVKQVVVTHAHPDHFGAAAWIAERSGAAILCGSAERAKILQRRVVAPMEQLFAQLGVPPAQRLLGDIEAFVDEITRWPDPAMLHGVADGAWLEAGGRRVQAVVTPGHAEGHLSLWAADERLLFSGDHLLSRISPNPIFEPDATGPGGRRPTMAEYLGTLDRFVALEAAAVLPGHHEPFTRVDLLVGALRDQHARRSEQVLQVVDELGEATGWEVALRVFPGIDGHAAVLGLSEVTGHLDLLVAAADVVLLAGTPQRFVVADRAAAASAPR